MMSGGMQSLDSAQVPMDVRSRETSANLFLVTFNMKQIANFE